MIATTSGIAAELNISPRRVQQIVKQLGLSPKRIGNTYVFTQTEFRKIAGRNTKPGPSRK